MKRHENLPLYLMHARRQAKPKDDVLALHFDPSTNVDALASSVATHRRGQKNICIGDLHRHAWAGKRRHSDTEPFHSFGWIALGRRLQWCPDNAAVRSQ